MTGLTEMQEDRTVYNVIDKRHLVPQQSVLWHTVNELDQQRPVPIK